MSQRIVECIPNFSEGRRSEIVDQIAAAIEAVPGITLLDRSSDHDHNRSVMTFVGAPEAVEQAAFDAIRTAAGLIDLDQHEGEHPRIGATDVVPFVPVSGVGMDECIAIAQRLGKRVGTELHIPVFLYENAATRPERANLENIRRGEYEALKAEIGLKPEREPDFGPAALGKAGATVIGARPPLIAYNVYLSTDDVQIAKQIARTVRHSSGGLRFVKALGLLVDGRAQVSMNLTDYTRTAIARVVEFIRREAERYGTGIHHCELIGLIPQTALIDAAQWYLQLDQFEHDQILETRLYQAGGANDTGSEDFLAALASGAPTPGGGSAAAYSGAMAAALVGMVARLTIGKKKYHEVEERMQKLVSLADGVRAQLTDAVAKDAAAFDAVMTAFRLPKSTPEEKAARETAIQAATRAAAEAPLRAAGLAVDVMEWAAEAAEFGNANAITDASSAAAMGRASLIASGLNVRINAAGMDDGEATTAWLAQLEALDARARAAEARVQTALKERANLD